MRHNHTRTSSSFQVKGRQSPPNRRQVLAALNVLRHLLLKSPDTTMLTAAAATLRDVNAESRNGDAPEARSLLAAIAVILEQESQGPALVDTQVDFTRLFFGPGAPLAPPYASAYLGQRTSLLMQEAAQQALRWYRTFDFVLGDRTLQPDQAGVEIEFLMTLVARSADPVAPTLAQTRVLRGFLDTHLGQWMPEFLRRVAERAQTPLFRRTAELGLVTVCQAQELLANVTGGSFLAAPHSNATRSP